jgi:hypothetical protein
MGLDKMDLSVQSLREVPKHIYADEVAQKKLSFLVSVRTRFVFFVFVL